jgi:hypothetical protein
MSCKYILNGKEYTAKELLNLASTGTSLLSVRSRSNDETIEIMKKEAGSRFVNLDLFTPYQETTYISSISTDIVSQIGSLKPGEEIKISPSESFLKTKAKFENSFKVYEYLESKLDTNEKIAKAKKVKEYIDKFPQLAYVNTVDDIVEKKNTFKNIVDNFDGFKTKVKVNLRKLGLKLVEGSNKFEELKLDEEYYRNLVNDETNIEEVTEDERRIIESYEDGGYMMTNPRDTASTRVKLFFATIPDVTVNSLGLREFVPYDDIIENFLEIGSSLEVVNLENIQTALIEKSKARPYLKNVSQKLGQLKTDRNSQLLNEIITFSNKAFQDQLLVKWEKVGGGVSVEIINSNRDSVIRQIYSDWLENQKTSQIVKVVDDQIVINTKKAAELKESLKVVNQGTLRERKDWVKTFMKTIGINFTDAMVDELEERANKGFFTKNQMNKDFVSLFRDTNLFSILVNKYNLPPTSKAEVGYDDVNNAMKDESNSFNLLAEIYYNHNPGRYQTGSFRNSENKSIYSYVNPNFLDGIKKKLKYSESFLKTLKNRAFSKSSKVINAFSSSKLNNRNDFTIEFNVYDGLKESNTKKDGVVRKKQSPKEQTLDGYFKHQNSAKNIGVYTLFTLSDKTTSPTVKLNKYTLNDVSQNRAGKDIIFKPYMGGPIKDSFFFGETFRSELYNLAESEITRIVEYSKNLKANNVVDVANFDKAFELFYLFPVLNKGNNDPDGQRMEGIRNKMYQGEMPSKDDIDYIKDVLEDTFKNNVVKELSALKEQGIINIVKKDDGSSFDVVSDLFDIKYLTQNQISGLNGLQKMIYTAADFKFNYLRAQITSLQIFGADPALYYKAPKTISKAKLADFSTLTLNEKIAIVKATMDEFSKRAAMFTAPGTQGVYKWYDENGKLVDRSNGYNAITLDDVFKNTELFKDIESTDGQEFVTLQEHIDRMMSEGKIQPEVWQSITNKINKNPKFFKLTDVEKRIVLQPTKPVHGNIKDIGSGMTRADYVKSSAYPLIPEVTVGTPLDDLRQFMETNNIQSANFKSAKKTGQPSKIVKVFGENDEFITPSASDVKEATQVLDREGLRNQQEIPGQKEEISNVSQMNRTLFDGLTKVEDFSLEDKVFNGKEFKTLKENIRIALFDKAESEFMQRFGIKRVGDAIKMTNKKAFEKLLIEESIERGFSINDIAAIKVDKNGELIIPPYLMPRADKFEGLINSLISKIVRLHNPGTSMVQVSGVASKLKMSELNKDLLNSIIYLPTYDAKAGLQYMRREGGTITKSGKVIPGVVKPAQVIVSQYLRDEEGNIIDLSKFVKKDPKTGLNMLDTSTFSPELFQLVASRIPNQSHPSMLPIEVVGFLPGYMENTIIVPDGITKQMGSDFDVDKLYAYLSSLRLDYSKSSTEKITELEKSILEAKEENAVKNEELYQSLLSNEDIKTIKDLKAAKNKIVSKLKWDVSQKEKVRKQKTIDNLSNLIESIYENVKEKNEAEYLKLKQRQELNNASLNRKIASIKKDIAKVRSEGITGATKVEYDLNMYNDSWESLNDMSEEQLNQMYRDLHWSVLTHPSAFEKITTSIDFGDIQEESDILEGLGFFTSNVDYTPMDIREQLQIFNDNKSGKVGTGIFASLGSFLADNQDKTIVLGHKKEDGSLVIDPIQLLDEEGNDLDLYKVTEEGSVNWTEKDKDGNLVTKTRTKGDNNTMVLSESLDNAKNKNLYKFDWGEDNMSALQGVLSLSSQDDQILRINFATRFFKQKIVSDYTKRIQIARDSFSDYVADVKKVIGSQVVESYYSMMSPDYLEKLKEQKSDDKYVKEKFNAKKLLDLLKDGLKVEGYMQVLNDSTSNDENLKTARDFINDYAKKQIDLFELYQRFDEIGSEISTVIGGSYFYTKGIGSNIFDVMDGIRKLGKLVDSPIFLGLEQMAGEVKKDEISNEAVLVSPKGEIGYSIEKSLMLARQVYRELYPVHFSPMFSKISEKVFYGLGIDKRTVGSARYIKINKQVMKGLRSYLFSSPTLKIGDDMTSERDRLLRDTDENKSLATRIEEAREKYPELLDNYFVKSLSFKKSNFKSGISQVFYKNPFGNVDELENNKGYLSLIFSGNDELINIAKDLALYSYVTGANETNSSFNKFIPIEYFISDVDFIKGIKELKEFAFNSIEVSRFYTQLVQNNPDLATKLSSDIYDALDKISVSESFAIDYTNELASKIMIKASPEQKKARIAIDGLVFPDFLSYRVPGKKGQTILYKRISSPSVGRYEKINTLGTRKAGFSEYALGEDNVSTIITDNMTKEQLKNLDPSYNRNDGQDVDNDQLSEGGYEDSIDPDDVDDNFNSDSVDPNNLDEEGNSKKDLTEEELKNPANYTNHSGGAEQTDSIFDEIGKRYGVINHKHYYDKSSKKRPPLGNTPLSKQEMDEGIAKVKVTYAQMGRPDNPKYYSLHGRNWFQVKNADAVFAVSDIVGSGEMGRKEFINRTLEPKVEGGTGYAVQMAINEGKPVYVFHQNTALSNDFPEMGWYEYNYDSKTFIKTKTPKLTPNFAGVGTSDSLTEEGVQAIEDLYKKTFGSLSDIDESGITTSATGFQVEYAPKGKKKQTYTVIGGKIFNSKGAEVFKEDSRDRNKIYANLAVGQGRALVITYKGNRYVVNDANQIMSVQTGDIMKWGEENGDRKGILDAYNAARGTSEIEPDESSLLKDDLIDNNLEVTSEPDDLIDTVDPNKLLDMDESDPNEIDISRLDDQPAPKAQTSVVDSEISSIIPDQLGINRMQDVLNNINNKTSNPFYKTLIKILAAADATKNISVLVDNSLNHPGVYNPGIIRINTNLAKSDNPKLSSQQNIENVIMHEVMHGYTADILSRFRKDSKLLSEKQKVFAKSLNNMFEDVQKEMLQSKEHGTALAQVINKITSGDDNITLTVKEKSLYYGLTNVDDFVSMLMTDREFQQFMNRTLYSSTANTSIFEKFKQLLLDLFKSLASALGGVSLQENSVLKNGIDNIVGLISEPQQDFTSDDSLNGDSDEAAFDITTINVEDLEEYELLTPNGVFEANEDQKNAIDKVSNFLLKPTTEDLEDNVFLLYGPGGTGKTASLATAIRKAKEQMRDNVSISYAAISHTAKGELIKAGNEDARTFASLIGSEVVISDSGSESFKLVPLSEYTKKDYPRPFPDIFTADVIVIDEASMIGDREMAAIRQRLDERKNQFGDSNVKILFMGDYAQIPPVEANEDQDGWAIDYRKNPDASVGLLKVERTKNQDITDLGSRFRRGIDFYNQQLEQGVKSIQSTLNFRKFLNDTVTTSSENVLYTTNFDNFFDRYVDALRRDPLNSNNAVMILYNNENNPNTLKINEVLRKKLFGEAAKNNLVIPGEPVFIKDTIEVKSESGKTMEIAKNSRMIVKSITQKTKDINFGSKAYPEMFSIPGYEVSAYFGKEVVSFFKMDPSFSSAINKNYIKEKKGYILPDGKVFSYRNKLSLSAKGITDFAYGYAMSAHKVQGQTYNHSFVHDKNISSFVKPDQRGNLILTPKSYAQMMYTAISRAREKVYVLTDNIKDEKGTFVEPKFDKPLKSPLAKDETVLFTEFPSELELKNQCKS